MNKTPRRPFIRVMHRRAVLVCKSPHDTRYLLGLGPRRYKHVPSHNKTKPRLKLSRYAYGKFKDETLHVMERAMYQPHDWKDTHTLRGEEIKLAKLLKDNSGQNRQSLEQEAFEAEQPGEDEEIEETDVGRNNAILPGTFIETRRSLILAHGVVLGDQIMTRRKRLTTLMSSGSIWFPGRYDVLFTIPNFVPKDLMDRCGPNEPEPSQCQKSARIEVLRRLREIERQSEAMHNIVSMKSATIYKQVKSPDPEAWNTTTLGETARLISPKPDSLTEFGLHKYLMSNALYFVADQTYETSRIIYVRPEAHVNTIKIINEWARDPGSPIQSFTAKVKKLIPKYQEIQHASRKEKPSYTPASHAWTADDRTILKFLHHSLRQTRSNQLDPYSLGVSYILKQIDNEKLDGTSDLYDVLTNIGALAPWQDLACLDPIVGLDTEPEETSSWIQRQEAIAARGFASVESSEKDAPLGPEDFHKTDPLEAVRHDFGDLPVFVIDDANAEELDDGVSIERIPSEPDAFWLHVHIADPASLIPYNNTVAQEAFARTSTLYLTHRTWPIFPKSLMSHPTLGLSLGRKTTDSPLRVITFSGKVDTRGHLLDYKVRAGLINNVNVITYQQANKVLGHSDDLNWYPFGRQVQSSPKPINISDSHAKDIRDIYQVARYLMDKRYRDGVIIPARNMGSLELIVKPPPEITGLMNDPMTFRGFPTFQYSVTEASDLDSGARLSIAESMKLACRVASRFCTDNNLPMVRRIADPLSIHANFDKQPILDMRSPNCYIPSHAIIEKIEIPSVSNYSLEPEAHYTLGVAEGEGYTRVTSPLRRYIDLMAHWQIHHALLGSKASQASPPFSAGEVWEIVKTAASREKATMITERYHNRFWQLMYIKRWAKDHGGFDSVEGPLSNLKAYTLSAVAVNSQNGAWQAQVDCPHLGLVGMLDYLPSTDIAIGSEVDVRVRKIVVGTKPQIHFSLKNTSVQ